MINTWYLRSIIKNMEIQTNKMKMYLSMLRDIRSYANKFMKNLVKIPLISEKLYQFKETKMDNHKHLISQGNV